MRGLGETSVVCCGVLEGVWESWLVSFKEFLLFKFFSASILSNNISPLVGFNKPKIKCNKVDFPDPDGPIIPKISPLLILKLKESIF